MQEFQTNFLKRIQGFLALILFLLPYPALSDVGANLDPRFATDGIAKVSLGAGKSWASAGAVQSDGKILIAGSLADSTFADSIALARVLPNGGLDDKFGDGGVSISKLGVNSRSTGIAVMPDGRIAVVGWAHFAREKEGIVVLMYRPDGRLDTRFGERGVVIFPMEYSAAYAFSIAALPNGKIVVGGKITIRKEHREQLLVQSVPADYLLLARLNENGTFDSTFGRSGVAMTDVGGGEVRSVSLTLQSDGRVLLSGTRVKDRSWSLYLARYNLNGELDKQFGHDGLVTKAFANSWISPPRVSVAKDGRIFLIGGYQLQDDAWLLLSRLLEDGSPDSTFGDKGSIATRTKFWRFSELIAVSQPDGRFLIGGLSLRPPKQGEARRSSYYSIGVSRFLQDGQPDTSFGNSGIQVVPVGSVTDMPVFMTVQENGRIVVAGYSDDQVAKPIVLVGLSP